MWEARATYNDGTEVCLLIKSFDGRKSDLDQQSEIEEFLITRKSGCNWYSVMWVNLEDE